MTDNRRTDKRMSSAELHTLTGAYAVHALPEEERREFARHLVACSVCAREVVELTATAERLGLAVSDAPPPQLREQVLRRIGTVRQEPPRVRDGESGDGDGSGAVPGGGVGQRLRAVPRFALAACVAAAASFGGVAVWSYQSAQDARQEARAADQRSEELSRVLAASDVRTLSSSALPGEARGTVVFSRAENKAVFLASDLAAPPSGKVYQLWFADGDTMRPAGLLDRDTRSGAVVMDGLVDEASGVGITVEPAGGSPRPTTEPLAVMPLPA